MTLWKTQKSPTASHLCPSAHDGLKPQRPPRPTFHLQVCLHPSAMLPRQPPSARAPPRAPLLLQLVRPALRWRPTLQPHPHLPQQHLLATTLLSLSFRTERCHLPPFHHRGPLHPQQQQQGQQCTACLWRRCLTPSHSTLSNSLLRSHLKPVNSRSTATEPPQQLRPCPLSSTPTRPPSSRRHPQSARLRPDQPLKVDRVPFVEAGPPPLLDRPPPDRPLGRRQ